MSISETAIDRPVTVIVIAILVSVVAIVMVPQIAVEMFPDVTPPFIMVQTEYDGAGPEEIEESVTSIIETALSSLDGLDTMSSTSSEGVSNIRLEFVYEQDLSDAEEDVREALEGISNSLPDDADSPSIMQFDPSGGSIMQLIMEGNESPETLKRIAEDTIEPKLERIQGVATAEVSGGEERTIEVALSANRLQAYGLTASTVAEAIEGNSIRESAGELTIDNTDYALRVNERYTDLETVRRTVVSTVDGSERIGDDATRSEVVRVEDVADVYVSTDSEDQAIYVDGSAAIQIAIINENDTNTVRIAEDVRTTLPDINAELPDGITVSILYDNTTYISSVLSQVYQAAIQGIILAMVILFIFLRNLRSTLIIGLSIPISLLVTLMCMYFFDITLNMISLTGLILGLGMIVDSSIVILENIYQYRERGAKLRSSAVLGSREMMMPIIASTLTTISVFLPLIIWKDDLGMIGNIFSDMVFTVVIALSVSLIVAVSLVPALSANIIKLYSPTQRPIKNRVWRAINDKGERALVAVENGYSKVLRFTLHNRLLIITAVLSILVLSAVTFADMGLNLLPRGSSDDNVSISLTMPQGTTTERTEELIFEMAQIIEENIEGYEHIIISVEDESADLQIVLPQPEDQIESPAEIQEILRPYTIIFPDADFTFSAGRGFGSDSPIDVAVESEDLDLAYDAATDLRTLLSDSLPFLEDVTTDLDEGVPQYHISVDAARAATYGLTPSDVATQLATLVAGSTPATYWLNGEEIDINVQLQESDRSLLSDLNGLFVTASDGTQIPITNVATAIYETGPQDVEREDQVRTVHVTADLADDDMASSSATTIVQNLIESAYVVPEGVAISYQGDREGIQELKGPLITVLLVALVLVFGIMAAQFESFSDPFIIFFSIPLLLIGVVGTYKIMGESLSLFSIIGMVVLAGIVVNNGIVMVDYINLLRKRGMPLYDAVVQGASRRLRPVLMTSLTTILGMVPLGFFPGDGTEMIRPIGQTIVGGLTVSTIITLAVTPIVYTLVNRDRRDSKSADAQLEIPSTEVDTEVAG